MSVSATAPASLTSRLIAGSQLACVVLFGALLARPWVATSVPLGTALIIACAMFAAAAMAIASSARGLVRLVFGAFALLAIGLGLGELWILLVQESSVMLAVQMADSLELAIAVAALNALLSLYGNLSLALQRRAAVELEARISAEQEVTATLEQRVVERTTELDDAQRVLHRMWWLGQQITVELNPRHVLERFLEAAGDVAQADGAALGLVAHDGMIELAAASGSLSSFAGTLLPMSGSAMGRIIRSGGRWSVADIHDRPDAIDSAVYAEIGSETHGMAIVPIQRRGERIGAVAVTSSAVREFSQLELERVEAMADLLSVALANAELFETMRQAEWRFRTLFRAAPDAVLTVLQATGRIREANDAVHTVFGLEPHQVIGRTLLELLVPGDRPLLQDVLARAFAGVPARAEVHFVAPGGVTRVVALAASRLPEADPPSALLVGRDMTAEREMRVRLMESDRLAAVGELVAGVAHEVNNPLSSISAFAQLLLRDGDLTAQQRESIEVIRAETLRASQVVKDLLAFARRSEPQRAPLDLNAVVERTLRIHQYQFAEAGVHATADLSAELPSVMGDPRQLQQVCLNLLTNAVQAMSATGGGQLRVRTYPRGADVVLEVSDTGPGIAPESRAHIFEPFFTTKKEGEGTGLGLSVSYGIIAAHGGRIVVAETGATGTTFRVTLPAGTMPASTPDSASSSAPLALRSPLAGIKLLFVDDEPALRSGMEAFGVLRGFTVVAAADGEAALATARTMGLDAVVCDLRMPGMDGYAFHDRLRAERPGLAARTIFITGDLVTTAASGSAARQPVLAKPFAFDRLEDALVAVMRGTPWTPEERER